MPRDIWWSVSVDPNNCVFFILLVQTNSTIFRYWIQVWFVHIKESLTYLDNFRINLISIDGDWTINRVNLPGSSTRGQANDGIIFDIVFVKRVWIEERRCQELHPRTLISKLCWMIDGMYALSFIQAQISVFSIL